jgi:hypothetical protein
MGTRAQWKQVSSWRWSSTKSTLFLLQRCSDIGHQEVRMHNNSPSSVQPAPDLRLSLHLPQHLHNLRQHLLRILTDAQCLTPHIPLGRVTKETLLAPRATHIQYANRHLALLRPLHQSPRRIRRQTTSHHQDAARGIDSLFGRDFGCRGDRFAKHDDRGLEHAALALWIPCAVCIRLNTHCSARGFLRRRRQTRRTRGVSEGRVGRVGDINVAVGIRLEALFPALGRVLRVEGARGEHFVEERRPGGVQAGELGLEGAARVFVVAGEADEGAEVAVEFDSGEGRVRGWVERVDVWRGVGLALHDSLIIVRVVGTCALCVITLPTTPILPKSPHARCALFGRALSRFVQPRKLRAQYLLRASWLSQNSLK